MTAVQELTNVFRAEHHGVHGSVSERVDRTLAARRIARKADLDLPTQATDVRDRRA